MKPLLKWPGGKRRVSKFLCQKIRPFLVEDSTYIEPFCGGAAVFFELEVPHAAIGDACIPLIAFYASVSSMPDAVYDELERLLELPFTQETYSAVREGWDTNEAGASAAATMLYLNRTCFNGLFRQNASGKFNVPWGKKEKCPAFPTRDELHKASTLLRSGSVTYGDFGQAFNRPMDKAVIYADPPYLDTFDKYTAGGFNLAEHERLASVMKEAHANGANIFASNINSEPVRQLYSWASIEIVPVYHQIGATGERRRIREEVLITATHG